VPWTAAISLPILAAVTALAMVTSGLLRGLHQYIMHNASHGNFGRYSRAVGETAVIVAGSAARRPDPQGHRSFRPSFSTSSLSPWTVRKPRFTCVSDGNPLERLLMRSKGGLVGVLWGCPWCLLKGFFILSQEMQPLSR
jgi:hypothetical protein